MPHFSVVIDMKKYPAAIIRFLVATLFILCLGHAAIPANAAKNDEAKRTTDTHDKTNRLSVIFLNPGISDPENPTGEFWLSVSSFMEAVARQLDIDLEIIYSERDHLRMQQQAREVASRAVHPDYLVVVNEKLAADEIVKIADHAGIKVFIILNTFVDEQAKAMGTPREKFKNWIGSLTPDNRIAGGLIAEQIIAQATAKNAGRNGQLKLLAIAGDPVTPASVQRLEGLHEIVSRYSNVELQQIFYGEWRRDIACQQTRIALLRYPQTGAIWTANDPMAEGAVEGALASKRHPGQDIFIGGLNWDAPTMELVKKGFLTPSVGGHFMTGGWALILLYDYHHGKDFADEGLELKRSIFGVINNNNIDFFIKKLGDRDWEKFDFRQFSKVLNPRLKRYNFNAEALLKR